MVVARIAIPLGSRLAFRQSYLRKHFSEDAAPPSYWVCHGGYQRYEEWYISLNGYELMERNGRHGWVYNLGFQYDFFF
jgi:hypothetical protein